MTASIGSGRHNSAVNVEMVTDDPTSRRLGPCTLAVGLTALTTIESKQQGMSEFERSAQQRASCVVQTAAACVNYRSSSWNHAINR